MLTEMKTGPSAILTVKMPLDDAISLSKDIYHLGVHIADVSNFRKQFMKQGTSVYLARVHGAAGTPSNGIFPDQTDWH